MSPAAHMIGLCHGLISKPHTAQRRSQRQPSPLFGGSAAKDTRGRSFFRLGPPQAPYEQASFAQHESTGTFRPGSSSHSPPNGAVLPSRAKGLSFQRFISLRAPTAAPSSLGACAPSFLDRADKHRPTPRSCGLVVPLCQLIASLIRFSPIESLFPSLPPMIIPSIRASEYGWPTSSRQFLWLAGEERQGWPATTARASNPQRGFGRPSVLRRPFREEVDQGGSEACRMIRLVPLLGSAAAVIGDDNDDVKGGVMMRGDDNDGEDDGSAGGGGGGGGFYFFLLLPDQHSKSGDDMLRALCVYVFW